MINSNKNYPISLFANRLELWSIVLILIMLVASCKKDEPTPPVLAPTENLALDSVVASKKDIAVYELIKITAYARGKNLTYKWNTNHGSMIGEDSVTVTYYACYSCIGLNTIECKVSNEYGTVSDTIMINVISD